MSEGGSVNVTAKSAPVLRADGPCLEGTLVSLGSGPKPMPEKALNKIKGDALDLLSRVVSAYETVVATGEVGASGSAIAGKSTPKAPCTGLLYGRIQSGKTVAMIALVAAAIDNGFRVVVVLTSDNVKLVSQTTERFAALEGPITLDALQPDAWTGDHKHIAKHLGKAGLVIVCSKNSQRLEELIAFLAKIDAPNYPSLILDDEADQATLNTNLAKSKKQSDVDPTVIYTRVVTELRTALRHHVFLQVTATPYALLLQSVGEQLRPSFTRLLEPGEGYTGGEAFFEQHHLDGPTPPIVFVPKDESQAILDNVEDAPVGLRQALAFFLVAAGAQAITDLATAKSGQNFLCHTSQLREQHAQVEKLIRDYADKISNSLEAGKGEPLDKIHLAYDELKKTMPAAPALNDIIEQIKMRFVNRKVIVMNARPGANSPEPTKGMNFIIGGNIIGRGVTVENLLVTYYIREPKTGQMDTTLQHARMYGYRAKIMHLTRVFLPEQLAVRFHEIHNIERRLRRTLATADMNRPIAIERATNLNPTRRAVLDPTYIDAFDGQDQVFPTYPDLKMSSKEYDAMYERVRILVGGEFKAKEAQLEAIEFDELIKLVEDLPYNDKHTSSSWVPTVLLKVLERQRERCKDRAFIYTRAMQRRKTPFIGGALSGEELEKLRDEVDAPVICAFRDDGTKLEGANKYWYPTLVFDRGMQSLIINVTPDGE